MQAAAAEQAGKVATMSAAFLDEFAGEPPQLQRTCEHCGRTGLSVIRRQNGKVICDTCDAAANCEPLPPRVSPMTIDDV